MKILSITCELPPFSVGGYEVGVWDTTRLLGEIYNVDVYFLTSMRGVTTGQNLGEKNCYRLLPRPGYHIIGSEYIAHNDLQLTKEQRKLAFQIMCEVVNCIKPDVVIFWQSFFYWHTCNGSIYDLRILDKLRNQNIRTYMYMAYWNIPVYQTTTPQYWLSSKNVLQALRQFKFHLNSWKKNMLLEIVSINWKNVAFCSEDLKLHCIQDGHPSQDGKIIYWGINLAEIPISHRQINLPLKILWTGRICSDKGLHILIEALAKIPLNTFCLDVYGFVEDSIYFNSIQKNIIKNSLSSNICFKGYIQPTELRKLLNNYDVFVFSSIWREPFSIGLLEALAAGLAIVTTLVGGTSEILSEQNSLPYAAESSDDLADKLNYLIHNPDKVYIYKDLAYKTAQKFQLKQMVKELYEWISI
jgi:glycogen(starch) synthase